MKKKYVKPSAFTVVLPDDLRPEEGLAQISNEGLACIRNESVRRMLGKTYVARKDIAVRQMLDEWLLIAASTPEDNRVNGIFSQNNVSHYLWELFQEPATVQSVINKARERFADPNGRIEADVLRFVDEYTQYKLLTEV